MTRTLAVVALLLVVVLGLRRRLLAVLTRGTGTWVGTSPGHP